MAAVAAALHLIAMDELKFSLEAFEGPLNLLLSLINKNKVSIYDIPIALIFEQYTAHLDEMRAMDMEVAGEFIVMAAELMLIKSRMLLPKSPEAEEEEDPRAALAAALAEYQRIKSKAALLGGLYDVYNGRVAKEPEDIGREIELLPHAPEQLIKAFRRILDRTFEADTRSIAPARTIKNLYSAKVVPVSAKILGLMRMLRRRGECSFDELMLTSKTRSELVAAFMALLELLRVRRVNMEERGGELFFTLSLEKHTGENDLLPSEEVGFNA